jgi:RNA polymerase sigma-70 factor (ECF subfamily)
MSDASVPDAELVRAVLAGGPGSEAAFRHLAARYERPLFSFVLRMVRNRSVAEDLSQEVLLKVFRGLRAFDPERKFSSWLFKIAHNATIDWLRRRGPVEESLDAPVSDDGPPREVVDERGLTPEQWRHNAELGRALDRAVAALRTEFRAVVLLRFREGLAYEEIAEATGLPLGTVKTFLFRARRQMAHHLAAAGFPLGSETSGSDST